MLNLVSIKYKLILGISLAAQNFLLYKALLRVLYGKYSTEMSGQEANWHEAKPSVIYNYFILRPCFIQGCYKVKYTMDLQGFIPCCNLVKWL